MREPPSSSRYIWMTPGPAEPLSLEDGSTAYFHLLTHNANNTFHWSKTEGLEVDECDGVMC